MSQKLEFKVEELVIIQTVKTNPLNTINPDTFKYNGTVPSDLKLVRQPSGANGFVRLDYEDDISVLAQHNRVMFAEAIGNKNPELLKVPSIASNYAQTLPNMESEGLAISCRGAVPFTSSEDARKYITEQLMSPGAWQQVGDEPMEANISLTYRFKRAPLFINISEATLRSTEESTIPIVLFSGSFSYSLSGETPAEKLASLQQVIGNWQEDLETFSNIVNNKFLAQMLSGGSIVPDTFSMNSIPAAV